jgi:hypothetical protein
MKKISVSMLLMGLVLMTFGQANCPFSYGEFGAASNAFLFGDKVNVRAQPNTTAAIISNKPIGSAIQVIEKSDQTFAMGGYTTNWYKVSFMDGETSKSGYVWGGLISMATTTLPRGEEKADQLVYGITGWLGEFNFNSTLRIVRDGKVLTSLDFDPISSGFFDVGVFGHGVCVTVDDGRGFKGIKNVIRLEFIYEACGYENGEIFILWDGIKLTYLAKASAVSEAGIFSYTYDLVFPDMPEGKPNTLGIIQDYIGWGESGDSLIVAEEEITTKQFTWDGVNVKALEEQVKIVTP